MQTLRSLAGNISITSNSTSLGILFDAEKPSDGVTWKFTSIFSLVIAMLVVMSNGSLLLSLLVNRELRSRPFSVYLVCLMTFNICGAVIHDPLKIINDIYPMWWLGVGWCIVYCFAQNLLTAGAMHAHVLITVSRLWAITFPWSYRYGSKSWLATVLNCRSLFVWSLWFVYASATDKSSVELTRLTTWAFALSARGSHGGSSRATRRKMQVWAKPMRCAGSSSFA